MEIDKAEGWSETYRQHRTKYYDFTKEVDELLKKILGSNDIDYVNIEARTKSISSFKEKISREGKNYTNPLTGLTDLSACRIICYYNRDIDTIEALVRKNFHVDEGNSEKKDKKANPKEFGYLSRHLVISFSEDRTKLPEYSRFKDMKAELQIRTALQHAWAAIEHKLQYKNQAEVPEPLQRKLFQISALLELADDEFEFLRNKLGKLREEYKEEIESGDHQLPINVESIDVYLATSSAMSEIKSKLVTVGYSIAPVHPFAKNPLSKLVETLQLAKIGSVSEADDFIFRGHSKNEWINDFKSLFAAWKEPGLPNKLTMDQTAILRVMVILRSKKSTADRILRRVPFGDSINTALQKLVDERDKATPATP